MRLFIRSIEVATDARLERFTEAMRKRGLPYAVAYWQRGDDPSRSGDPGSIPFRRRAAVGSRWRNVVGLLLWNVQIARIVWSLRRKLSLVHAVDLDSGLTAYGVCRLLGVPFVFDIYDSYPDSRGMHGLAGAIVRRLEGEVATRADLTIIADVGRRAQHRIGRGARVLVVENVPTTHWQPTAMPETGMTIGYLGNLEAVHRGLEDILRVVADDERYSLLIAGAGALEGRVRAAAEKCDRITFFGPVAHIDGMALMARSHILLGLYYLTAANHRYAAPNKYYEHLILGRPLLTTFNTPPGEKVREFGTGWAIPEGGAAIAACLDSLAADRNAIVRAGQLARKRWESHYDGYTARVIMNAYIEQSQALAKSASMP